MAFVIGNERIIDIVKEVEQLDSLQQSEILAYIRALRFAKSFKAPAAKAKNIKPISIEEIDRIKHLTRKQYAGK